MGVRLGYCRRSLDTISGDASCRSNEMLLRTGPADHDRAPLAPLDPRTARVINPLSTVSFKGDSEVLSSSLSLLLN